MLAVAAPKAAKRWLRERRIDTAPVDAMPPGTFWAAWASMHVGMLCSPAGKKSPAGTAPSGAAQKKELTMDNHDVIATLNGLLEISRDGEQGFHTCAEGVESTNRKALFEAAARRCAEGAAELEAKVRSLGGEPAQGSSISGSMHRAWTNIKSTITGMSEHAVLAEC
jgi:hypothetical protein